MSSTTSTISLNESSSTVTQYGFFIDQSRCTICHACAVACKSWNMLNPGPVKLAKVYEWETGSFPNITLHGLFTPCFHCANPACIPAANGAMYKEPNFGAVLIDPNAAHGPNLRAAWEACPYGSIVFDSDKPDATAYKCTMCIDRLVNNQLPACVTACPNRALDFGLLSDLQKKYGTNQQLDGMPSPQQTNPSVVFKPTTPAGQYVPYDVSTALSLLGQRGNLPPFFTNPSDVTVDASVCTTRNSLNMQSRSVAELMQATKHDEG